MLSNLLKRGKKLISKSVFYPKKSAPFNSCPLCNSRNFSQIFKGFKGILRCDICNCIVNLEFQPSSYDRDYFFDEYRSHYGKSYEEDRKHIIWLGNKRIENILIKGKGLLPVQDLSLLDIGCAMGFFLEAASEKGIKSLAGIEISKFAADYCKINYGLPIINDSFDNVRLNDKFDIITAWYFIEHCGDPLNALKKIYSLLKAKGIFAFSTPSIFGPMFYFNREEWVRIHPIDHCVDFSPSVIRNTLQKIGFSKVFIRTGGIHPERIMQSDSFLYPVFKHIYIPLSKILRFSDTMEVIAVKK